MAMMTLGAGAAVVTPEFYSEDFVQMGLHGDQLTGDWLTYGNGAKPDAVMSTFFNPDGSGPYYILIDYGSMSIPFSCTNFEPSAQADQWLVTPEIEIPSDEVELSFTAAVYCNRGAWGQGKNPYKILVSENGGSAREDFAEVPVFESTVSGSRTADVALKEVVCPLNGFGGKKVRLAFVSTGENLGMTGFTNIALGNYAITLDNKTPKVAKEGDDVTVSVNVGLKAPVTCPGFTATLEIGGEKYEQYYKKPFGNTGNVLIYQLVKFEPIAVASTETLQYTVSITPDYADAPATTLTGAIGVPTELYGANVVVEEVTATGCQACPSGSASMRYYHDTYPGNDEGLEKVIGIAIHGFINYYDPMSEGVESYLSNVLDLNGTTSYPQAMFNRATRGLMPDRKAEVEKLMEAGSYNKVKINSVTTEATEENPWGEKVKVAFDAYNAYDAESLDLRAAVVMIENNVKGNNSGYDQTNGFYNRTEDYIAMNYGDFLVPYMAPYLSGGEFGQAKISFTKMVYDHVARGIWPSFFGQDIEGAWTRGVANKVEMEFEIPQTIMHLDETEVVVLLIDGETNAIVASDIMDASAYNADNAVGCVGTDAVAVALSEGALQVSAPEGSNVDVYTAAGLKVASAAVSGSATVAVPSGLLLVRVTTPTGVATYKLAD